MKFNKQLTAYLESQESLMPGVSYVEFKRLKKLLKHCPHHGSGSEFAHNSSGSEFEVSSASAVPTPCPECDKVFFPILMKEIADVLNIFNARVQRLLEIHLASGIHKYMLQLKYRSSFNNPITEAQSLTSYVSMNVLAIRKILKKYDRVHSSKIGQGFRSQLQTMHVELLQSPWLVELIAFHLSVNGNHISNSEMASRCSCDFENAKPTVAFMLSDSIKLEVDLTCSICLDIVFDPVSLGCGHMFCNSCVCSAASVPTVEGPKTAPTTAKCPLCRQEGVYKGAVRLVELSTLIKKRCPEYWEKRLQMERKERLEQAKKYWDQQCQSALGF